MVNAAKPCDRAPSPLEKEFERLEPHLGRSKAVVAIARKLLGAVWHVLSEQVVDRFCRSN